MRNIIPGDIIGDGYTCLSVIDSGYFAEKEMPEIGKVKVFIDKHTGMLHNVYDVGTVKPVDPSFGDVLATFNDIGLWKNSKYIVVGPYFNDYAEDPIITGILDIEYIGEGRWVDFVEASIRYRNGIHFVLTIKTKPNNIRSNGDTEYIELEFNRPDMFAVADDVDEAERLLDKMCVTMAEEIADVSDESAYKLLKAIIKEYELEKIPFKVSKFESLLKSAKGYLIRRLKDKKSEYKNIDVWCNNRKSAVHGEVYDMVNEINGDLLSCVKVPGDEEIDAVIDIN